jgi:hypothetical protein
MSLRDELDNLPGEKLRRELETVPGANLRNELEKQDLWKLRAQREEADRHTERYSAHLGAAIVRAEYYAPTIDYSSIVPNIAHTMRPEERQAEEFMEGLKAHAKRLEESLWDDQELQMFCCHGYERLQVLEISMPSLNVVALHCLDNEGRETHVTGHMHSVNFSFMVRTIEPPKIRTPIGFNMPRSSVE